MIPSENTPQIASDNSFPARPSTDQEKIQRIVEFMGGWPEHDMRGVESCHRCRITPWEDEVCYAFNPFTRIEDAFMVVERIKGYQFRLDFNVEDEPKGWLAQFFDVWQVFGESENLNSPARAITEAAWRVIERITK